MALKPLFVGTTVVGIVAGLVTYFLGLGAVREVRHLAHLDRPKNPTPEG